MTTSINHGQYELVYTQCTSGETFNHKDIELPEYDEFERTKVHSKISYKDYLEAQEECTRSVQFKKEQIEFQKKQESKVYQENMNEIQKSLAFQMVVVSDLAEALS